MFDGLNLGLAINIADGATVNANKISSSIEKLIQLSNQLGRDAKKDSTGVDALANSFAHANRDGHTASGGIRSFGASLDRLQPRLISVRSGIIRLFPYVSVFGGLYAIKRGFDDAMNTFSEYEYAMKNMQAATGYNVGQMNLLDKQFRELAVSGRFTAKEIAEAGYDLTTTIEIDASKVKDLTQSVLNYATATQYSVKESGLDMLALLSKMNRPLTDSTMLFDQMAKATNITSLTAGRLSEMLKITGTEALAMGVPFNQLLALMGRTDLYYKGGEGGTRLRMMFQMLAQDTKQHTTLLAKYGMTTADVDIKARGLANVLGRLKGMSYGDLARLVGGYSAGLVMRLSQDMKSIDEMAKTLTESESKGTTGRMYGVQMDTLDGRRKRLKNIVDEMQLTLANATEQPYAKHLGQIAGFITEITEKMSKNSGVLKTIFGTIFGWVDGIGSMIARHIKSILGWTGLLAETQKDSQRLMQNNLIPFIVFVEVMGLRVWKFIKGFASGFWDGAKLVWNAVSSIGGWISDLIGWVLPLSDQFGTLGYVLGLGVPLLWGLGRAAAVLQFILPLLGVELQGVSAWTALWNTVLLANPILIVGSAILAVLLVQRKYRQEIQDWVDTLPDWAQAIASSFTLGFLNDEKYVSRWVKLWDSISGVVFKGVLWIASQIDSLLGLLPKAVKVFLGVDDEGLEKKLKRWNNGGVDFTPKGESVIQYENPKSKALADTGVMLTDQNTISDKSLSGLSKQTSGMYANFGNTTGKTNWGVPDAAKARPKVPETPATPEKPVKKESGSPATTAATKKDQSAKYPGAPSATLSPKIIVPRGEIPAPRVMPNATIDQVDTEEPEQERETVQVILPPVTRAAKIPESITANVKMGPFPPIKMPDEMPGMKVPALTAPVVRVEKVPTVHVGISEIKPVHIVAPTIPNVGVSPMKPVHIVAPKIPALSVSPVSPLKVEVPKLPELAVQSLGPMKVEAPVVSPVRLLAPVFGPVQLKAPEPSLLQMLAPSIAPLKVDTSGATVGVVPKVAEKQEKVSVTVAHKSNAEPTKQSLPQATSLAKNMGGMVKVTGLNPPGLREQVQGRVASMMPPGELDSLGLSEDLSEYQDQANAAMDGYKNTADAMMSKIMRDQKLDSSSSRTVSPQTINQEFKFGDINIDAKGGDPERIARELVPYIRKVVREEMGR